MRINITAGECLKEKLEKIYPDQKFIPFNEAMIIGTYTSRLFSDEFILERANTHNVSVREYKEKLQGFLNVLENIKQYSEVFLYFGDEPFCNANKKVVIESLRIYGFDKKIVLVTVDENNGNILSKKTVPFSLT